MKNKKSQTITDEFSNDLTTSKRSPLKLESDRGGEWYNSTFQNFSRAKNIQHCSRFTDKSPSVCERVIRTVRNLFKKPSILAGNADWLSELSSNIRKKNHTIHNSIKITLSPASKKVNEKLVYSNSQDRRIRQKPNFKLADLVRTANFKKVFSKGDSTNYNFIIYKKTEVIHDTIPSYR